MIRKELELEGIESPRPYRLGSYVDDKESTKYCILYALMQYCDEYDLEARYQKYLDARQKGIERTRSRTKKKNNLKIKPRARTRLTFNELCIKAGVGFSEKEIAKIKEIGQKEGIDLPLYMMKDHIDALYFDLYDIGQWQLAEVLKAYA